MMALQMLQVAPLAPPTSSSSSSSSSSSFWVQTLPLWFGQHRCHHSRPHLALQHRHSYKRATLLLVAKKDRKLQASSSSSSTTQQDQNDDEEEDEEENDEDESDPDPEDLEYVSQIKRVCCFRSFFNGFLSVSLFQSLLLLIGVGASPQKQRHDFQWGRVISIIQWTPFFMCFTISLFWILINFVMVCNMIG